MNQLCPAKVNLALSVGLPAPGEAEGLHPIASWMVKLDFADELAIERADATQFTLRFADDAPQPQPIDWPIEKDLAYRAHHAVEQYVGRALPVRAAITKRIPAGAGLGGGSSNAAGMLLALNELFELHLTEAQLMALAKPLGSDVVFATNALTSALITGLGDRIEPTTAEVGGLGINLILILPPLRCPTGAVYRTFDEMGGAKLDEQRVRELMASKPLRPDAPFNDLAEAAMRVEPKLADVLRRVAEVTNMPVHVTGSGAAMFIVADSAAHARALAETIEKTADLPAVAARTL